MIWLSITDWPYEVNDLGQVRNSHTGRVLRQSQHKSGYANVQLWKNNKPWTTGVHQLVAAAFLGPKPSEKHEVRHLDGNRLNSAVYNLAWGLHVDNMRDRDAHGTTARGERNGKIKHSDKVVAAVRALARKGISPRAAADKYDVHPTTAYSWIKNTRRVA